LPALTCLKNAAITVFITKQLKNYLNNCQVKLPYDINLYNIDNFCKSLLAKHS